MDKEYIHVLVDKFGFLGAFTNTKKIANLFLFFKDKVELLTLKFPLNPNEQQQVVYFIPYKGHETENRFPVALVTNDRSLFLKAQQKMVDMDITYPDHIKFMTKELNVISPLEFSRLTQADLRLKDTMIDHIFTKILESDNIDTTIPFDEMMAGIMTGSENILGDFSRVVHVIPDIEQQADK